jgi:hypothetical protein
MRIASPLTGVFNGTDLNASDFNNSRIIGIPDIRVDDYIVDAEIGRIGADLYSGSEFTGEWKNGIPPIEWRYYSTSRRRSFGYLVLEEQEKFVPIKNLPQEYLARKMSTTVLRDHDKYVLLAIVLGRMSGKLVPRVSGVDTYGPVTTDVHKISCTGNQADYKWIAEPGEDYDNEMQPSFATIKGMEWNAVDPLKTLDALTLQFSENWWDSNISNSERVLFITSAMEITFRDVMISKGTYVDKGFDMYMNSDISGANGPSFLGELRGGWRLMKIHPEFMPKVFVDASNVVDPNPTLTGVGTATSRTLKQVAALAVYKGSAQVHEFFADKRQEDGGIRFKGTAYVQDFAYDAWVIDQKSEGIIPIFLPSDLDGNGTTDANYTPVNDQFVRVAALVAAARTQLGTSPSQYPMSGYATNISRPTWYTNPFTSQGFLNAGLTVQEAGDRSARRPILPENNPVDAAELSGIVQSVLASNTARANSTAVTLGQIRVFGSPTSLWIVTTAGTTAASQPSIASKDIGASVTDGTAVFKRIL